MASQPGPAPDLSPGKPRLLVASSTFPRWAGDTTPRFVLDLCRSLAHAYDITVVAPHCRGAARRELLEGIEVVRFRYAPAALQQLAYDGGMLPKLRRRPWLWLSVPLYVLGNAWAIRSELRRRRVDLLHAHWLIPGGLAARLGRALARSRVPLVCTAHGSDVAALTAALSGVLLRWVARGSARIGVVSPALGRRLAARGVPQERIAVLSMGVEVPATASPSRDPATVAFAGRMVAGKGVDRLLEAFATVAAQHPSARLELAGDGPELAEYRARAGALGDAARIRFHGALPHDAVLELFARASVAVVPSDDEGLGLTVLEAMGCGCAVVATRLPALEDVVSEDENARTVPPGDVAALAGALLSVLRDPALAARLGARARADVARRFGWPAVAARHCAIYAEAVAQP